MQHIVINVETGRLSMTPLYLAEMSRDLYEMSETYLSKIAPKKPMSIYYTYAVSIELGLKSAILSKENTKERKKQLKDTMGHNLEKVYAEYTQDFPEQQLLDEADRDTLRKITRHFAKKDLEYGKVGVLLEMFTGYSTLPSLTELRTVARKINEHLLAQELFINS